jgi:hypothetical protein
VNELAVQSKQDPVIADPKPVAALVSFQLLDVPLKGILEHFQTVPMLRRISLGKARNCSRAASWMMSW